jgi:hypothetical protein
VLIVGALTFFPALALGPIVEHLLDGPERSSDHERHQDPASRA